MTESLFPDLKRPDEFDVALTAAYVAAGRTLDDLPYTAEFEAILDAARVAVPGTGERAAFQRLHNLRKAAKLPRIGRAASTPPRITGNEEALLVELVKDRVGTLGQRDQLPYTPQMDEVVQTFNERSGRNLLAHDVWRLVAKLAK